MFDMDPEILPDRAFMHFANVISASAPHLTAPTSDSLTVGRSAFAMDSLHGADTHSTSPSPSFDVFIANMSSPIPIPRSAARRHSRMGTTAFFGVFDPNAGFSFQNEVSSPANPTIETPPWLTRASHTTTLRRSERE